MLPVLTTTPLKLNNRTVDASGVYQVNVNDIVVLRVTPVSSGNATPTVRIFINWGDGSSSSLDFKGVGLQSQFQHQYSSLGPCTIIVQCQNTDGGMSAVVPNVAVALRVVPITTRGNGTTQPHKWAGLALPAKSIQQAYAASQSTAGPIYCGLTVNAPAGSLTISVDSSESAYKRGEQIVITQPGKMITTARIMAVVGNQITLDSALLDSYSSNASGMTGGAVVELKLGSQVVRTSQNKQGSSSPWYFPVSFDADLIKASVRTILSTRLGERVMRPTFGTKLPETPFEQNDPITIQLLTTDLVTAVQTFETRATVASISMASNDNNEITGKCFIQIADGSNSFDVDFAINQSQK